MDVPLSERKQGILCKIPKHWDTLSRAPELIFLLADHPALPIGYEPSVAYPFINNIFNRYYILPFVIYDKTESQLEYVRGELEALQSKPDELAAILKEEKESGVKSHIHTDKTFIRPYD